jgi:hypothetical protein
LGRLAVREFPEAETNEALLAGKCQRSERALVAALVEMHVQGVSTRKVRAISEFKATLDGEPERFARQPLEAE